jgi:C1A family cysteine protease
MGLLFLLFLALVRAPPTPNDMAFEHRRNAQKEIDDWKDCASSDSQLNGCIKKSHLQFGTPEQLNDDQKNNFKQRIRHIRKHNERFISGDETFFLGMNQFSHMSEKEMKETILTLNPPRNEPDDSAPFEPVQPEARLQERAGDTLQLDWRNVNGKSYVTPIRDQNTCGSCYAFAAVSVMESALLISYPDKFNMSLNISENSAMANTNYGCNGGYSNVVMDAAADKNVTTEAIWPYRSTYYNGSAPATYANYANNSDYFAQPAGKTLFSIRNSSTDLKNFIDIQPTVIYIYADTNFSYYRGGYFNSSACNPNWYSINHAVVAVGYDMINKHWLIRNSWGTIWGERGYIRMAMWDDGSGLCNMYYWTGMRNGLKFKRAFGAQGSTVTTTATTTTSTSIDQSPTTTTAISSTLVASMQSSGILTRTNK